MRNLIFIILFFIANACSNSQKNKDDIVVNFNVQNPTYSKVAIVQSPELIDEIELDKNGKATCTLQGDLIYARLFYGEESKNVFLQKGDQLTISFDAGKFKDEIRFEGKNAPVNDYLNAITYTEITPDEYAHPLDELIALVQQKTDEAIKLLQARKLETVNPDFVTWEKGRIKYMYAFNILMHPMGYAYLTQDTSYQPGPEYYTMLSQLIQGDEQLANLPLYREFVAEAAILLASPGKRIPNLYDRCVSQMKYLAENIQNEKVKQVILNDIAMKYVKKNGIRNITDLENIYNAYVSDPDLRAAYKEIRDQWDLTSVGRPSPDFKGQDINGKTLSLKDFNGKYLYIDVWATWCGPCKMAFPGMQMAVDKYAKDKEVEFYFIATQESGDKYKQKIKEYFAKNDFTFNVLYDNYNEKSQSANVVFSRFAKMFNDSGIPRKVILKDGVMRYTSGGYCGSPSKLADEISYVIELLKAEK